MRSGGAKYREYCKMENSRKKSCAQCRAAKTRCNLTIPRCLRCEKRRLPCKYEHHIRNETSQPVTPYHTWLVGTRSEEPQPPITGLASTINPRIAFIDGNERNSEVPEFDISSSVAAGPMFQPNAEWDSLEEISIAPMRPGIFSNNVEVLGDERFWTQRLPGSLEADGDVIVQRASPPISLTADEHFNNISRQAIAVMENASFDAAHWYALNVELKISPTFMCRRREQNMSELLTANLSWTTIRNYAIQFGQKILPPFIHRSHLEHSSNANELILPETLENCSSLISMYLKKTKNGHGFVNKAMIIEIQRLYREVSWQHIVSQDGI
jgi:hypothetical protein